MSDGLIAIGGVSPAVLLVATLAIAIIATILLALAPILSKVLLRFRARRLPFALSERLLEEWLAEVHTVENRFGKLTFAVALALTRTKSLVVDEDEASLAALPPGHHVISVADVTVPTGFPIRLVAYTLDLAILFPVSYGTRRLFALMPSWVSLEDFLPSILLFLSMQVYFVAIGGSPGKILAKLRIVTLDGTPITYKHAFLRAAPLYFLGFFGNLAIAAMILSRMTWADFVALAPSAQRQLIRGVGSVWFAVVFAWNLGDVMAFFALDDRRALHDRVAGTIVVHKVPLIVGRTDAQQPPASTSAMR